MSTRLFIGVLTFYIMAQIICNFVEGNNMVTNANIIEAQEDLQHSTTTTTDIAGTEDTFFSNAKDTITRIVFFKYSIFYDVDPDTGEQTANQFVVIRYLLFGLGIAILFEVGYLFKKTILGG